MKKTWVGFKNFVRTDHCEPLEATDITIQDAVIHHANMVHNVVAGLQDALQKKTAPVKAPAVMLEPQVHHVENSVQDNQPKIAAQLQQIQIMMQEMQL